MLGNEKRVYGIVFQLTTSRRGRQFPLFKHQTRAAFQLTTSRRGRLVSRWVYPSCRCISTHDLTKRSTPLARPVPLAIMYFNSRPHEEVDFWSRMTLSISRTFQLTTSRRGRQYRPARVPPMCHISTHDLTKRSTFSVAFSAPSLRYFNSRPHEEVDCARF